jgi:predicted NUDIX family phosphoesterase
MAESSSEVVLVVPTKTFHKIGNFQGFCGQPDRYLRELLLPENLSFRSRGDVENDPSFKQLIPYVIVRWAGDKNAEYLFQYTRSSRQDESRLRTKRSIGIGGHISESDVHQGSGASTYERGMRREISEEIQIQSKFVQRCVGLINDDSNDVGRVHLGLVHIFDLEEPLVSALDPEMCDSGFESTRDLVAKESEFETWSQICLKSLFSKPKSLQI